MYSISFAIRLTALLFVGMSVCLEVGYRLGARWAKRSNESEKSGISIIDASIFGLMGLLLAFTFGGAVSRFDYRRQLIVEETNAISTAYGRLDMFSPSDRNAIRMLFKHYVDSRIKIYELIPDVDAALAEVARSNRIQKEIWDKSIEAARKASPQPVSVLLLPALNEMFDVANKRVRAGFTHIPTAIIYLLIATGWACSILAGYSLYNPKGRNIIHMLVFAIIISIAFYIIIDLEYPRLGLITLRDADHWLIDLRASFN